VETELLAHLIHGRLAGPGEISARANRFQLPHSSLWFCAFGSPVAISFPEPDHFRVQFHHAGTGATRIGTESVAVTPEQAVITSTAAEFDFRGAFQQVVWRVHKDFVRQKLATLTDLPLPGELTFQPKIDLRKHPAQLMTHLLSGIIHAADMVEGEAGRTVLGELEQALLSTLLAASEHDYVERLQKTRAAAPWQVRRAEAYIAAHWDRPLEIETLAEVTGASVRSVFRAFKQSRGYTPFEFAKRIRLNHARRLLEQGQATGSVTDVCFACGFSDLGRFGKDFAQAFGERPSDVLKRSKASLAAH
jgi:AraC-like DNA-binding protein